MAEQLVNPTSAAQLKPRNSEPSHVGGASWDDLGGRAWDGPAGPEGYKVDASKGVKGKDTSIPASVPAETSHLSGVKTEDDDKEMEFEFGDKNEAAVDDLDKAIDEGELPDAKIDVKAEADDDEKDVKEADDDEKDVKESDDKDADDMKEEDDDEKKEVSESRRFWRALRLFEADEDEKDEKDEKDVKESDDKDEDDVKEADDDEKDVKESDDKDADDMKEEDDDEKKEVSESLKIRIKMPNASSSLFESAGFSSSQQKKVAAIFESAIKKTTRQVGKQIREHYQKLHARKLQESQRLLETRMNAYLDVVIEEWMSANKVAVRQSLRADLAENFMTGLQQLFKEHYIDVPASKVDVVNTLTQEVENLKRQVNEQHVQKLQLRRLAEAANKKRIVAEFARNLSEAQAVKLEKLAEDTEYVNAKDFREKLSMLKESYFDKRPSSMTRLPEEDVPVITEDRKSSKSEVDVVADAISRQVKSSW